ncbi:MAG: decarboxylating 6-phosphogluconate dehydrogenase [Candidatus Paceibacterota bacterium]
MKRIGYIGFGKMGLNQALRLKEQGIEIVGFNRSVEGKVKAITAGIDAKNSIKEMCEALEVQPQGSKEVEPRIVWIMVSHQGVDEVLNELYSYLNKGDIIIDGGNSFYKESMRRALEAEQKGFEFLDAGVSGGPNGARNGACIMVGGKKEIYDLCEDIFKLASAPNAYKYFGISGAGHFVKMVHNGIEYGMMQAIGEGFEVLKRSEFNLNLKEVSELYQNRSVVESRLVGWLHNGFEKFGEELVGISGEVSHSGECEWTVNTAKELNVPVKIIEDSLEFRKRSAGNPSFTGKVLSTMRTMFGGHEVKEK